MNLSRPKVRECARRRALSNSFVKNVLVAAGGGVCLDLGGGRGGCRTAVHQAKKPANSQVTDENSKRKCRCYGKDYGRQCHKRKQTIL